MAFWNCRLCKTESDLCKDCHEGSEFKRMSQADKIKSMSNEELAEFFSELIKDTKMHSYSEDSADWLEWLKEEVKG